VRSTTQQRPGSISSEGEKSFVSSPARSPSERERFIAQTPERAGGLGESFAGRTVYVALGRGGEQPAGEQVVARRDADGAL
jgi:hypothetical protein